MDTAIIRTPSMAPSVSVFIAWFDCVYKNLQKNWVSLYHRCTTVNYTCLKLQLPTKGYSLKFSRSASSFPNPHYPIFQITGGLIKFPFLPDRYDKIIISVGLGSRLDSTQAKLKALWHLRQFTESWLAFWAQDWPTPIFSKWVKRL